MGRLWQVASSSDLLAAWLAAGTSIAGLVASGVGYLIRRAVRLEHRLDAVESLAGDALQELSWLRDDLRDRRGRRWYETHPLDRSTPGE